MNNYEELLAANNGLILTRDHPQLRSSLSRWAKEGRLIRVMRGAYAHPEADLDVRVRAALALIPGAVITGQAAAALTIPGAPAPAVITVCAPGVHKPQPGWQFTRRKIPTDHVENGIMSPVMAAVDVADKTSDLIDQLMQQHQAEPSDFIEALDACPGWAGNTRRRQVIYRTGSKPLSAAERQYHDLLDANGIKGWIANELTKVGDTWYMLDIQFRQTKLVIEIDGYAYHSDREAFEEDRHRQNDLTRAGWTILRFTWDMLNDPERIINLITDTLNRLRRLQNRTK